MMSFAKQQKVLVTTPKLTLLAHHVAFQHHGIPHQCGIESNHTLIYSRIQKTIEPILFANPQKLKVQINHSQPEPADPHSGEQHLFSFPITPRFQLGSVWSIGTCEKSESETETNQTVPKRWKHLSPKNIRMFPVGLCDSSTTSNVKRKKHEKAIVNLRLRARWYSQQAAAEEPVFVRPFLICFNQVAAWRAHSTQRVMIQST